MERKISTNQERDIPHDGESHKWDTSISSRQGYPHELSTLCAVTTATLGSWASCEIPQHCYNDISTKRIQKHRNGTEHTTNDWNPLQLLLHTLIGLFEPLSLYGVYTQEAHCNQDYSTDDRKIKIRRHIFSWDSSITTEDCSDRLVPGRGILSTHWNDVRLVAGSTASKRLNGWLRGREDRWRNLLDSSKHKAARKTALVTRIRITPTINSVPNPYLFSIASLDYPQNINSQ